jgi:hypothetical protein
MQCFRFLKTMMTLFNMLIFVSTELCAFGGPYRSRSQSQQSPICTQTLPCKFPVRSRMQKSSQMLIPGPSSSQAATTHRDVCKEGVEKL